MNLNGTTLFNQTITLLAREHFPCPTCKARRGQPCRTSDGIEYRTTFTHKARRAVLDEARASASDPRPVAWDEHTIREVVSV